MTDKAAELKEKLAALRQSYIAQLDERIESLESAFEAIKAGDEFVSVKRGLKQLSFHAHKLAGTAGTFGFTELGEYGSLIEQKCDGYVKAEIALSDAEKFTLEEKIATCRSLADEATL